MKINKYLFYVLFLTAVLFSGCERVLDTEGISRITNYAIITLNGEQWNTIPVGGTFTDPGASAKAGDEEVEVKVSGDVVDPTKPGVYTIVYTATNKDGYAATERRYVGVIAPDAAAQNLSGQYKRNAGAQGVATITRIADGFYFSNNVGGTAATDTGVYFYHFTGNQLGVPPQLVNGSLFYCTDATVNLGVSYSWVVVNSGYGPALRTFVKL
jgi:hypothetical protein